MIKGLLFDVDGTLVDSNEAHALAWQKAFGLHKIDVWYNKVRRHIGMGTDNLLPSVIGIKKGTALGKSLVATSKRLFEEDFIPVLKPFPRVRELFQRIKQDQLKIIIASSAHEDILIKLLGIAGVADLFDEKVSASDVHESKPDPDIVAKALEIGHFGPSQVYMVGDTPYDIEAAAKLNVETIAFRCGGWSDADLFGAIAIYDSPAHLLREYNTSPISAIKQRSYQIQNSFR